MKSTEPTNIFKLGVKETGQSAPTITLAGYFFLNMNVTQAATPPAKWITHGYFVIELQTVKLVPTDQPALNILPPRQFCSLIG